MTHVSLAPNSDIDLKSSKHKMCLFNESVSCDTIIFRKLHKTDFDCFKK